MAGTQKERLLERERLLSIAGRMARLGGWTLEVGAGIVVWSDEVCDILEVPHGAAPLFEEVISLYAPDARPLITGLVTRCVEEGVPFDVPLEIVTAAGRRAWVRVIGEAVRGKSGAITSLQGALQDISQQKEAEEALAQSEHRFRQMAESMPLIVWSATADGEVDFETRNMWELSGLDANQLAGDGWLRAVHPDDVPNVVEAWRHSVDTGDPYQVVFRIHRTDGSWRWHLTRALPFRDSQGTIRKWYGSSVDIHDQLALKSEAESLARRLTTTLESITDAFYLLSPDWRFAFVNAEAGRILEREPGSLLGRTLWDEFPTVVGSALDFAYRRAMVDGQTAALHFNYKFLDRWYDTRAYPSSEGLAVYFRDVTAERRVERQLREQAALLDRAQEAILVRALDHTLVYWNAGAERLYGWTREEALGASVADLLYDGSDAFFEATRALIKAGEWTGELRQRCKDGRFIWVEGHWSLVRGEDGQPDRILAINTDITERKQLLEQFLRAQRMETIGTLAGGIAHDLNNVFAPILLSIEILKESIPEADSDALEILATIETSATSGADLVRQVLGFARGFERSEVVIDVRRVIADVVRVVRDTFPRNIDIRVEQPEQGLSHLLGDPTQLQQVFMNLVVNARDAMPRGGVLTIKADMVTLDDQFAAMSAEATTGKYVQITVSDTGTGMARDTVAQIFDPFFTTKEPGKGTGLGLSTVASIVRNHRGFVNVYSEPGRGTTFRIHLPALNDAEAIPEWTAQAELRRGDGELILVVDDEKAVRDITRQTLESFGYRVITAENGQQALDIHAEKGDEIDLVLTDIAMPVFDGPAAIRILLERDPKLRIIAASGFGTAEGPNRTTDLGVHHFLPKPFTAETLLQAVHQVLQEGRL